MLGILKVSSNLYFYQGDKMLHLRVKGQISTLTSNTLYVTTSKSHLTSLASPSPTPWQKSRLP